MEHGPFPPPHCRNTEQGQASPQNVYQPRHSQQACARLTQSDFEAQGCRFMLVEEHIS